MKILVVNDDGIEAKGLWAIATALLDAGHEVVVVAPCDQQSGTSHAVTLHGALSFQKVQGPCPSYRINGTPCDCVKFAMLVLTHGIDCVISGINDTMNIGTDVLYSGTVNAALEGAIEGIPSIAISVNVEEDDYEYPARFVVDNLHKLMSLHAEDTAISVNMPTSKRDKLKGIQVAGCGVRKFDDFYIEKEDGFHIGGMPMDAYNEPDSDLVLTKQGYICVTPVRFEMADRQRMRLWRKITDDLCW